MINSNRFRTLKSQTLTLNFSIVEGVEAIIYNHQVRTSIEFVTGTIKNNVRELTYLN